MSTRINELDAHIETMDLARTVAPEALARMRDARNGYPSSGFGGRGSGGGSSSPVERAVLGGDCHCDGECTCSADTMVDRGRAAMAEHDRLLAQFGKVAEAYFVLVKNWAPHESTTTARAKATASAAPPECEHHRRTIAAFEAMRVKGNVVGNLPTSMALCDYCYRWVLKTKRLPTQGELERHQRGLRNFLPAKEAARLARAGRLVEA